MRCCIVSSLGVQTYGEKYNQALEIWLSYWNHALFLDSQPIDAVDLWHIVRTGRIQVPTPRHTYMNGIVLGSILRRHGAQVSIVNAYNPQDPAQEAILRDSDAVLISTGYTWGKWEEQLCTLVHRIRTVNLGARIVIGGAGAFRLYHGTTRDRSRLKSIIDSGPDAILISRHGIEKAWSIAQMERSQISEVVIEDSSEYEIASEDYAMDSWPEHLQSTHMTVLTAHGCPFSCAFCDFKRGLGRLRYASISVATDAIRAVSRREGQTLPYLRIADECFNIPEERALSICDLLAKARLGISWCCFLRGDKVTSQLATALRRAGCTMVSIGLESGSDRMQSIMRKNLNLASVRRGIALLQDQEICVVVSLLIGFYGENRDSISETIRFLQEVQPDLVRINVWGPPAGEDTRPLAREYGLRQDSSQWIHSTMSEGEACDLAAELYTADLGPAFVPPFSSVFDQWPVLAGAGLSGLECKERFRIYYDMSLGHLPLIKDLRRDNE